MIDPTEDVSVDSAVAEKGEEEQELMVVVMEEGVDLPTCTCRLPLKGMPANWGIENLYFKFYQTCHVSCLHSPTGLALNGLIQQMVSVHIESHRW